MTKSKGMTIQLKKKKKAPKVQKAAKQELTRLGGALRMLGGLGGRMAGNMVGYGDTGAGYGSELGATISRWLGSGDYAVSSNSIVQRASSTVPSMHKDGQTIIVRHKEFITEVISNTSFTVQQQYNINPGLAATFPWLAGVAAQYSEYRVRGMVYHYVPTSGNAVSSTNASLGSVMLQTSYRASEAAPTTKLELLNEYWACESKPSEAFCHPIECDPKENPFNVQYVRSRVVPAGDSVLMYDLGKTTLAVSGQQATGNVLGDLWCTYEIELRKPVVSSTNSSNVATVSALGTASVSVTNSLSLNMTIANNTFPSAVSFGANSVTIAPGTTGTFCVVIAYPGTTAAAFGTTTITGAGSSLSPMLGSSNGRANTYSVGTGTSFNTVAFTITNPATTTTLTFSATNLLGPVIVHFVMTECNPLSLF